MPGDAQLISALMQTAGHKKLPLPVTLKLANRSVGNHLLVSST